MLLFILKRLAIGVGLLFGVSSVTFLLIYSGGANIAEQVLGGDATPEAVAATAHELGLDLPLWQQYLNWLLGALRGDLGTSFYTSQPVLPTIIQRLSVTLSLVILAMLIVSLLAAVIGVFAAVRRGWVDSALQFLSVIGLALPSFWVALVLVNVFANTLHVMPATGYTAFTTDPGKWLSSVILPVAALSIAAMSATSQQVRSAVISVLEQDYVRTLRSRGLSARRVLWGHVLRNAAPPALTVLSLQFISLTGGAVIIERVFAINGMGSLAVDATLRSDVPVVVGVMVTMTIVVVVVNLVIDIINGFINPKARLA